jgi:hypothetical protein
MSQASTAASATVEKAAEVRATEEATMVKAAEEAVASKVAEEAAVKATTESASSRSGSSPPSKWFRYAWKPWYAEQLLSRFFLFISIHLHCI